MEIRRNDRLRQPITTGRRTGRLRRCPRAPDCLLRPACSRRGKNLVNEVSLPPSDRLLDAFTSFGTALAWPEAQNRIGAVLERGLQSDADFEKNWPEVLGKLVETEKKGMWR